MSDRLIAAIKRHAAALDGTRGGFRWGIVQSVDPVNMRVRVMIQPEGVLSGWLPITQTGAGGGLTLVTVPQAGWQAAIVADNDEAEHGVVVGFAHNDASPMPSVANAIGGSAAPAQPGETILSGPNGAVLRINENGTIFIAGDTFIEGNLTVSKDILGQQNVRAVQDITDQNQTHGSVATLRSAYNTHEHPVTGVQAGSSTVTTGTTNDPVS
ncbi:MAG: phage baseplate assembly protein V [Acetobacteraceae bacterium]|nr:phage baseplate assembly protein V [Acetobacteraceae bacterium]